MDRLYQTTGWGAAWGGVLGAAAGAVADLWWNTSGLLALVLSTVASLTGSFVGFYAGRRDVERLVPKTNFPLEMVKIRKQHGAMWALMGAMVGGAAGSLVASGVVAFAGLAYLSHSLYAINFMTLANIMMGAGMGGMTGAVAGAWLAATKAAFVGNARSEKRKPGRKKSTQSL